VGKRDSGEWDNRMKKLALPPWEALEVSVDCGAREMNTRVGRSTDGRTDEAVDRHGTKMSAACNVKGTGSPQADCGSAGASARSMDEKEKERVRELTCVDVVN
jgi:hypothetical protein